MTALYTALENRFGADKVQVLKQEASHSIELLTINIPLRNDITVLMTNGLSDYLMPVLPKHKGREHIELCFCLPAYWDLADRENPRMNWVIDWLNKLSAFVLEKNTWFGIGHTIPAGNPLAPISSTMKQSYFFISEPILLREQLKPMQLGDKTVHFLSVIPIFEDEFDYKIGKGTQKFQKKFSQQNVDDLLDDYRSSVLKNKWRFFGADKK